MLEPQTQAGAGHQFSRSFVAGQVLYQSGEAAEHCFFLKSGRVRLSKRVGSSERSTQVLRPGDVFGLEALVGQSARGSMAVAIESGDMLALDRDTVQRLLSEQPEVTLRLVRQLVKRVHAAEERLENQLFDDPSWRVVHCLVRAATATAQPEPVRLSVTPLELSSRTGLAVDETKDVIRTLRDQGYLDVVGEQLQVPALEPLRQLHALLAMGDEVRGSHGAL